MSTGYSTLRKALRFVGWPFLMALGCPNLLKNSAINTSISSFFFPPVTLDSVDLSQVNLSKNLKRSQSYNSELYLEKFGPCWVWVSLWGPKWLTLQFWGWGDGRAWPSSCLPLSQGWAPEETSPLPQPPGTKPSASKAGRDRMDGGVGIVCRSHQQLLALAVLTYKAELRCAGW